MSTVVVPESSDPPPQRSDRTLGRRRRSVPYALLAPGGVYLIVGFVLPLIIIVITSLKSGGLLSGGFKFTWEFSNYTDVLSQYKLACMLEGIYARQRQSAYTDTSLIASYVPTLIERAKATIVGHS